MMGQTRLPFELDQRAETGALTAYGGVPLLIEAFRVSGAAGVLDQLVAIKRRQRGLRPSELVEGLFALWAAGGERCEDLAPLREDAALALLLGHGIPAPQTARDFLEAFDQAAPPLWQGETCHVQGEGERLQGLTVASRRLVAFLQARKPQATATIDLDATILESHKRSAKATYDGRRGYQPVIALWAEQDVVLADEFRDGNVPAGTGNQRLIERAIAALPPGIGRILVRADSAAGACPRAGKAGPGGAGLVALARGGGPWLRDQRRHEPRARRRASGAARGRLAPRARGQRRDPALGRGGVRAERWRGDQGPAATAALSGAADHQEAGPAVRRHAGLWGPRTPTGRAARSSTSPS
jgi:hypothetical protein